MKFIMLINLITLTLFYMDGKIKLLDFKTTEREIAMPINLFFDKTEEKKHKKIFSFLGFSYIFSYALACLLAGVIAFVTFLIYYLNEYQADFLNDPNFLMLLSSFLTICSTIFLSLFLKRKPAVKVVRLGLSGKSFASFILISIGIGTLLNILTNALISVFSNAFDIQTMDRLEYMINSTNFFVLFLTVGILAPVFEEIFFRKLLCDRVIIYGEKTAVLLSGLMFGLFHGNLYQFFYAFGIGAVLAYMYCKTGKLRYCVITHMIINMTSVILIPLMKYYPQNIEAGFNVSWQFYLLVIFVAANYVAAFKGIYLLFKKIKKVKFLKGSITIPDNKFFKTVFLNPGMTVFALLFLVVSVVTIIIK